MIEIRSFAENDYHDLVSLLKEADLYDEVWDSKENVLGIANNNSDAILIAKDNEKVVGNLFIISYGTKVAYFFRLAVKKEYQNKGIGSQLIASAEEFFKKKGFMEFGLYVDANNKELQEFYKIRGFKTSNKQWIYMFKE